MKTRVDLITGFLGSGKTTFLRQYAKWLMDKGQKIGIIENDFGAVNVDMMFLQDLEKDGALTEMVAGGSDIATYRRRFRTKLIALGMQGLDRVLIEPSGVFDVDEFFDVLYDDTLQRFYEIGNVIAIADAKLPDALSREADYLLVSQLSDAGAVLLSRGQEAESGEIAHTIAHINRAMEAFQCKRRFSADNDVIATDWKNFTDSDFEKILSCGYRAEDHIKLQLDGKNGFGSIYLLEPGIPKESAREFCEHLLGDQSIGSVFRVKGFIPDGDGWLEVNANHNGITEEHTKEGQDVIILVGEDMQKEKIQEIVDSYAVRKTD